MTICINKKIYAGSTYYNSDTGYKAEIVDNAELLSSSEENSLIEIMQTATLHGDACALTVSYNEYNSAASLADYYIQSYNYNAVVLLIDMDTREIYIKCNGDIADMIPDDDCYTITDNVYKYATNGEYYKACLKSYEKINYILEGGKIAQPLKYISIVLLSIVAGFLVNFCIILATYPSKQASISEILQSTKKKIDILNMDIRLINKKKIYDPPSSSSSGGRSGGGGGGGHSSGGGHRF